MTWFDYIISLCNAVNIPTAPTNIKAESVCQGFLRTLKEKIHA